MSWDSTRPIPWKRLGLWLGVYAALMIGLALLTNSNDLAGVIPGVVIGVVLAATVLIVLTKFGWRLPMMMSREEMAAARADKVAARQAAKSSRRGGAAPTVAPVAGPRPRAAPTSRTSTGPSRHPGRSTKPRRK